MAGTCVRSRRCSHGTSHECSASCALLGVRPDDLEDVAQDVLIRIFRHLDGYRRGGSFGGWVYRIAVNSVHDYRGRGGSPSVDGRRMGCGIRRKSLMKDRGRASMRSAVSAGASSKRPWGS